jgi:hypothetical protein
MNTSRNPPILIEPLGEDALAELSDLYFRRCNIMGARNVETVAEYLRKNFESKNHLHGSVIRGGGNRFAKAAISDY